MTNQKGFAPILIVFVVAVLAFGGYYYFGVQKAKKSEPVQQAKTIQVAPEVDETTSWKTYTNTKFGFSFKYPPNLKEENGCKDPTNCSINSFVGPGKGPNNFIYVSISKGNNFSLPYNADGVDTLLSMKIGESKSINNFKPEYFTFKRLPDLIISDLSAKTFLSEKSWEFPENTKQKRVYINRNNDLILIGAYTDSDDIPLKVFDQILSTFKFTDQNQTADTSNWKTYTNSLWKVSIEYPGNWTPKTYGPDPNASTYLELSLGAPVFGVKYHANPNHLTLEQIDEENAQKDKRGNVGVSTPKLSSDKFTQVTMTYGNKAYYEKEYFCEPSICQRYVIPNKDSVIEIIIFPRNNLITDFDKKINQILSTFKFN